MKNNFKRSICFILIMLLCATTDKTMIYAEETADTVNENAYVISTQDDLISLADSCKKGEKLQSATVVLDSDLDMKGYDEFIGIDSFSGVFEGNGHTVSNINFNEGSGAIGFFGFLEENAVVRNLTVDGVIYSLDNNNYVGLVCGVNAGTIENCHSKGIVTGTGNTGGIAGLNGGNGQILSCENKAEVYSLVTVAGIAGENIGLIKDCVNYGNIDADSSWLSLEDSSVKSISIDSIIKSLGDSIDLGSDIGGIAGYSTGEITGCNNNGTVGYQHTGKNVGGIVGRFNGKITDCGNTGKVYGKQDVGGIAGQFEPVIVAQGKSFNDYISELESLGKQLSKDTQAASISGESQLKKLSDSISEGADKATSDIDEATGTINDSLTDNANITKSRISSASKSISALQSEAKNAKENTEESDPQNNLEAIIDEVEKLSKTVESTESTLENYDVNYVSGLAQDQIDSSTNSAKTSVNEVSDKAKNQIDQASNDATESLNELSDSIANTRKTLTKDINAISDKISDITSLAEQQVDNFRKASNGETVIEDYSAVESTNESASRLSGCKNTGYINGDRNVGGIAGAMAIEGSDSEDENDGELGQTYVTLAVLEDSDSNGLIEVRKENAGGIVGNASLGFVNNCTTRDRIMSDDGNYIGGIAGYCEGTIANCNTLSMLGGSNYIGGIAGAADKVRYCIAIVDIEEDANWSGEIIGNIVESSSKDITVSHGKMLNSIYNNYYVNEEFGGINNVSYNNVAELASYDAVCDLDEDGFFENLNIYFYDEDYNLYSTVSVSYGDDLDENSFPKLMTDENTYLIWDGMYSDIVLGNFYLVADDMDSVTVLASDLTVDKKAVVLVSGNYYETSSVEVVELQDVDLLKDLKDYSDVKVYEVSLLDTSMSEEDLSEIRFYVGDAAKVKIYELDDSGWIVRKSSKKGSYVESSFYGTNGTFAVEMYESPINTKYIIIAIAAVLAIFCLFFIKKIRTKLLLKRKKAKK